MKVAVLGLGTVGTGIWDMLSEAEGLSRGRVLVRAGKADAPWKTDSLDALLEDPDVEAVAEAIGGTGAAYTCVSRALEAGKHVVTANKALVAEKGPELQTIADAHGAAFLFSAACGGGVPLLHNLALARKAEPIYRIRGILNGTTNYMLDRMQRLDLDYKQALRDAQALGYAEADPTADVSGLDALRKIILAAGVAFGVLPESGLCEGIEHVSAEDIRWFREQGLVLRLIAQTEQTADGVSCFTEPVLFPQSAPEAAVADNNNLASYEGRCCGRISLMGQGAGRYPTASAVIRDLESVRRGERRMFPAALSRLPAQNDSTCRRYLIRVDSSDREIRELSVRDMHALAASLRKDGRRVMFAALDSE